MEFYFNAKCFYIVILSFILGIIGNIEVKFYFKDIIQQALDENRLFKYVIISIDPRIDEHNNHATVRFELAKCTHTIKDKSKRNCERVYPRKAECVYKTAGSTISNFYKYRITCSKPYDIKLYKKSRKNRSASSSGSYKKYSDNFQHNPEIKSDTIRTNISDMHNKNQNSNQELLLNRSAELILYLQHKYNIDPNKELHVKDNPHQTYTDKKLSCRSYTLPPEQIKYNPNVEINLFKYPLDYLAHKNVHTTTDLPINKLISDTFINLENNYNSKLPSHENKNSDHRLDQIYAILGKPHTNNANHNQINSFDKIQEKNKENFDVYSLHQKFTEINALLGIQPTDRPNYLGNSMISNNLQMLADNKQNQDPRLEQIYAILGVKNPNQYQDPRLEQICAIIGVKNPNQNFSPAKEPNHLKRPENAISDQRLEEIHAYLGIKSPLNTNQKFLSEIKSDPLNHNSQNSPSQLFSTFQKQDLLDTSRKHPASQANYSIPIESSSILPDKYTPHFFDLDRLNCEIQSVNARRYPTVYYSELVLYSFIENNVIQYGVYYVSSVCDNDLLVVKYVAGLCDPWMTGPRCPRFFQYFCYCIYTAFKAEGDIIGSYMNICGPPCFLKISKSKNIVQPSYVNKNNMAFNVEYYKPYL